MDDFSAVYEKLIYMGFANDAIDCAIKKGMFTFDKIFTELVEVERSRQAHQESCNSTNGGGIPCQPNVRLAGRFGGGAEDNVGDGQLADGTESCETDLHHIGHIDYKSLFSHLTTDENNTVSSGEDISGSANAPRLNTLPNASSRTNEEDKHEHQKSVATSITKVASSTMSCSLVSNNTQDLSNKKTTKIQIMDLLDPGNEPLTYNHTFLSTICTVRDLICWFQQCRYSTGRAISMSKGEVHKSQLSIASDVHLHELIEKFQQLKWHLVSPSGATQPTRIYGSEYLDKTLDYLGLFPSAYLLAIVSCPSELQKGIPTINSESSSFSTLASENRNQSSSEAEKCAVHIRMINYRNNPLYFQGKASFTQYYDPQTTTLQTIAVDFSNFCQVNIASFTLLQMHCRQAFSFPDDYLRTLAELGLYDNITLYCHSTPLDHQPQQQQSVSENSSNNNTDHDDLHPPIADPSQLCTADQSAAKRNDLFHLCFQEIYRLLTVYDPTVCSSVWKLPNNLQQTLIQQLLEAKFLTTSVLSCFCATGTNLTSLDLSYSTFVTNEVLKCASKCTSLEELVLDNEDHAFSNEGLWHLRSCSNLKRLSLNYCGKINDWGIQVVGVLPSLAVLAIKYTAVTNVGLKHIYLHLNNENDTDSCSSSTSLRSIDLSGLAISDECLPCIGIFLRLELLNLSSSHITNPALLPHLPELRHIDISHCYDLIWDKQVHIRSLSECFPKLTSLCARGVSNSNLVHVTMAISHCKYLRQIDGIFCHPQMTASLAASLSHLPLETVILTNCRHVTDLWLPVLARLSETLTHLVLSSCPSITGENNSLVNNLSRLRNLSWLDLSHLESVNPSQICQLVMGNYFPELQVLWISLTDDQEVEFRALAKDLNFKVNVTQSMVNPIELGLPLITA